MLVAAAEEDAVRDFASLLAAGDLGAAAACFTREACLITPDNTAIHGREQIAGVLAQLIARRSEISIEQLVVRRAGPVALVDGRWTIRCDGPGGTRFSQSLGPTAVLREVEGRWKIAIAAPWGAR